MILSIALVTSGYSSTCAGAEPIYRQDFSKSEEGKVPDDMLVLDGGFAVRKAAGETALELPGAPLETFGVLFGPSEKDGIRVSARIHATAKGRRFPVIGTGLNGAVPYRLQITPAKKALELFKGDDLLTSVAFSWVSDSWTVLRLQLKALPAGGWRLEGRAWKQGDAEPAGWTVSHDLKEEPVPGRASIWGKPFSETPIRFDDLVVEKAP